MAIYITILNRFDRGDYIYDFIVGSKSVQSISSFTASAQQQRGSIVAPLPTVTDKSLHVHGI